MVLTSNVFQNFDLLLDCSSVEEKMHWGPLTCINREVLMGWPSRSKYPLKWKTSHILLLSCM